MSAEELNISKGAQTTEGVRLRLPRIGEREQAPVSPRVQWWTGVALVVLALLLVFPYRNFAGDDAYISFRFARNLANGHGFGFNPYMPTYGSTAPMWVFLMALGHQVGFSIPHFAHFLNFVFVALTMATFWSLSGYFLRAYWIRCATCVLLAFDPWFIRWSLSGMENAMTTFLISAAMLCRARDRNTGRTGWLAFLCAGVGILTRPEMAVFTLLLFGDVLFFERKTRWKTFGIGVATVLAVLLPWLAYAQANFGSIIPNTILAKVSSERRASLDLTIKYFVSFYAFLGVGVALAIALKRKAFLGGVRNPEVRARWFLPAAWMVALPLFYIVGGAPVAARYLMFGLPAYLLVGGKGLEMIRRKEISIALVAFTLPLLLYVQAKFCWYLTKWDQGMDPEMVRMAVWLRDNTQPDDLIACDQIGVIGYISDRYVLDTVGLVWPEAIAYNRSPDKNAIWRYIYDCGTQYFINLENLSQMRERDPVYDSLEVLGQVIVRREGAGSAENKFYYNFFRTHWPKKPIPHLKKP